MARKDIPIDDILAWMKVVADGAQLCSDSRQLAAGELFLAYPGDTSDGRRYIADAISRGAAGVVFEQSADFEWNASHAVPHKAVPGLRRLAGPLARGWYGAPDQEMFSVAVTGTNGKTSCTHWLGCALSQVDGPVAVVGTLGAGLWADGRMGNFSATGFTTPDAVQLQRRMAELRAAGAWALAIEASSIGLQQGRMDALHVDVALFTNLTRDHLDVHRDMAEYEQAKAMLFDWPGLRHAVINLDDPAGLRLLERLRFRPDVAVIGYTIADAVLEDSDIPVLRASEIKSTQAGTGFNISSPFGSGPVRTQLVGRFNVSNVLGIAGVLHTRGIEWETIIDLIENLQSVPGRMQQLGGQDAPLVVIDYAHTPDALEKTLACLREVAQERGGRLWCVFGCGGDRDPGKRPEMGAVVAALADDIVVTSDNPRSEDPGAIIQAIIAGMPRAPQTVEDRAAAILWAIRHSSRADVVLLAGKGHENYQEIKGRKQLFLDADHAALALLSRATMKGNT
ncbi:UDP-N-acetylmuramoyl-L-alanyl-D-glutamate--2,6-diaminopimelate ligase [Lacisediminimonas sp.]|uniref:UDP-N-acetylmuramoyl-L-alanyl-D-glutamate--2, 6-diaminopimelate ligase n=1 Tax=Lacisediminimonas sp. TaxID=3060582 RepID=UPI002721E2EA|nr:UDP-N-acetylmuramoyl-L-alanyl-D-glutamate--2,6-diaminopimelate ligase [Lacisediminimonas sp.]MDO8298497.1 UDP-N-acetylmuramoyl-L-alanyl-D-glutamate--2,6-diaminopimelate ligase [Lacisediminimonas sp.]MDO9217936.1 UDP-N-acetylmuramoyl-L-alanyl-D-glutamate--2,6-diaminopimelate ligase [Lacisediminimonas sp.]